MITLMSTRTRRVPDRYSPIHKERGRTRHFYVSATVKRPNGKLVLRTDVLTLPRGRRLTAPFLCQWVRSRVTRPESKGVKIRSNKNLKIKSIAAFEVNAPPTMEEFVKKVQFLKGTPAVISVHGK